MRIGILRIYFQIPDSQSLKDKRRVMKSLKDRLFQHFNVSVAEIGSNELLQIGELGIVTVANEKRFVESVMQKTLNFVEERGDQIVVLEAKIEVI